MNDWDMVLAGLKAITPSTPIEVAIVVARTAVVMCNKAKEQQDALSLELRRVKNELFLLQHAKPMPAKRRKRAK